MTSATARRSDITTMLLDRVGDQRLGLRTCNRDWTWDQVMAAVEFADYGRTSHVGLG